MPDVVGHFGKNHGRAFARPFCFANTEQGYRIANRKTQWGNAMCYFDFTTRVGMPVGSLYQLIDHRFPHAKPKDLTRDRRLLDKGQVHAAKHAKWMAQEVGRRLRIGWLVQASDLGAQLLEFSTKTKLVSPNEIMTILNSTYATLTRPGKRPAV